MKFNQQKPVYRQIADYILENVLSQELKAGDRLQSIRNMAAEISVNANTVVKSFNWVQEHGLIYNQKGIGYFISEDALEKAYALKKAHFINEELPNLFKTMDLLQIDFQQLEQLYKQQNHHENQQ